MGSSTAARRRPPGKRPEPLRPLASDRDPLAAVAATASRTGNHRYRPTELGPAIRQGTASTKAILRRFTRSATHPTYQAMLEVGRAQRTIFVDRYLRSRELQSEITEGLNLVEAFNGTNSVIYLRQGR